MKINIFKVNKLYGSLSFELRFEDNTLILVGENGSCKTTIIRILYYTLSCQWGELVRYDFESVEVEFSDRKLCVKKEDLQLQSISSSHRIIQESPELIRRHILNVKESWSAPIELQEIKELYRRYNLPVDESFFQTEEVLQNASEDMLALREKLEGMNILYLPTYRRIEQELEKVLDEKVISPEYGRARMPRRFSARVTKRVRDKNYAELVEFGMEDVSIMLEDRLDKLKDSSRASLEQLTLKYLEDIVGARYQSVDVSKIKSIDEGTIDSIINRVDAFILSEERKRELKKRLQKIKANPTETIDEFHDKVVCHYFLKLYEAHNELNKEEASIRKFTETCNRYLRNKELVYDSPSFNFSIMSKYDGHKIELLKLSSGEKQIVSLFSHLYLSNKKNYFVLIDEPELSLSVKWQKSFLQDVKQVEFCSGLVAVTHSPFIFENDLDCYAHGIEEFRV